MVKLSQLATTEQVLAEALQEPGFWREWDRTAFARAVAERLVVVYRAEHELTQTQLAPRCHPDWRASAPSAQGTRRFDQRIRLPAGRVNLIKETPGHSPIRSVRAPRGAGADNPIRAGQTFCRDHGCGAR
jgi:hypothetical protein